MSLISRLSGISSQNLTTEASNASQHVIAESEYEINETRQNSGRATMEPLPMEEVDQELKRPPYLHVS